MHRSILWGILSIALIAAGARNTEAKIEPARPDLKTPKIPLDHYSGLEVSIGQPYAPLTIVMYYSLSCGHCHDFQEKVLPEIKTEFIDKGLVRFVYRDFPTDHFAVKAAKVAWCMGKDHYLTVAKKLLATQDDWAPTPDDKGAIDENKLKQAENALLSIAKEMAITDKDYRKCLVNQNVEDTITRTSFEAQKTYHFEGAPGFLVNGKKFDADMNVEAIRGLLLKMGIHG